MSAVDAHVHFWRMARRDNPALLPSMAAIYEDREPSHLAPHLKAAGIERIVVVQASWTLAESLFTIGLSQLHPVIAGVVGWIDPVSASLEEELAALVATGKLKGVRPVSTEDNRSIAWMLDARFERCWRLLERHGLVLDVLLQNPDETPLVAPVAERHPGLSIVLDHCAKPDIAGGRFEPWAHDIAALSRLPNVSCKFSGLINCAGPGAGVAELKPFAAHTVQCFGPERLIWGSDWPPLDLAASYPRWREVSLDLLSGLAPAERTAVLGDNAERIYRLGG